MPAMEFQKICKDIALFSDTIIINASFSEVAFNGSGNFATYKISYVRENKNKYKEDDEDQVNIRFKENVSIEFTVKYLIVLAKAAFISNRVCISVANNQPIVIRYNTN